MPRSVLKFVALTAWLALLGGCASVPGLRDKPATETDNGYLAGAFEHMQNEAYGQAETELLSLLEDDAQDAQVQLNLGIVYSRTGRLDEAMATLERARALAPQAAPVHNELGIVLRQRGDFAGAAKAYRAAIEADGAYANAHYNLGVLLDLYLRQHAAALTHYEAYLSLSQSEDKTVQAWVKDLRRRAATGPTTASSDKGVERR